MLLGRIELPTSSLPMTRSTTELQQRASGGRTGHRAEARFVGAASKCQAWVAVSLRSRHVAAMAKPLDPAAREERLAAKLRENLHRRKAQARALDTADRPKPAENDSDALSKQAPES